MWAIFERADDGPVSSHLQDLVVVTLAPETEDVKSAFALNRLEWR